MTRSGTPSIDPARLAALRAAAQLLHRPGTARHPADVARAICGAQAQDLAAGRLAFRARNGRLRAVDVDRARTEERSLLRTWVMRRTMHLIATEDEAWLAPLFERAFVDNSRRRLAQLGVDSATQERGLREIRKALDRDGPQTRRVLVEHLRRKGIALDSSTRLHLFGLAVARRIACLGPDEGSQTCLVLAADWLGERPPPRREAALAELARRYLRAFGPATEADFAGWAGLGLREIRSALAGIARELIEARVGDRTAWTLKGAVRRPRRPDRPSAAGLGHLPDGPPGSGVHRRAGPVAADHARGRDPATVHRRRRRRRGHLAAAARREHVEGGVTAVRGPRRRGGRGDRRRGDRRGAL